MEIQNLIDKIESFCRSAINRRYDGRFPVISFFKHGFDDRITSYNKNITIDADRKPVKYYHYRLPQTRIFFSQYEFGFLDCIIIEYFDSQIVLFKNESEGKNFELQLQSRKPVNILASMKTGQNAQNTWRFKANESAILWVNPPAEKEYNFNDIPAYLNIIKEREYKINPINQLVCTDVNIMQRIDETWSNLSAVDKNGDILPEIILQDRKENIFWLQEIFLHLGREDELRKFYSSAKNNDDLKGVISSAQQRIDHKYSGQKNLSRFSFLKLLHFSDYSFDESIDNKIQDYWQFISQPYLELYFAEKITEDPDEFIAFALIAFYRNFWWFNKLYSKIDLYLSAQSKLIFEILFLLKQIVSYQKSARITIGPGNESAVVSRMTNNSAGFNCSYIKQNKKRFTIFSYKDEAAFKIDKFVSLEYDKAENSFKIFPNISRPPHGMIDLNYININAAGCSFMLPLVWEQFEVKLNLVRIKFLRKKNRFQLTIRQRNDFPEIAVNREKLVFSGDKKLKMYVMIQKNDSKIEIIPFTEAGSEITRNNPLKNEFWFTGTAIDVFGVLKNHVNITFNDSKKSSIIAANQINKEPVYTPGKFKKYKLSARKCDAVEKELHPGDRFLEKFRNTPAHILKAGLIVHLAPDVWKEKERVQRIIRHRLGFNVSLKKYGRGKPENGKFNLIIADKTDNEICISNEFFKLIQYGKSKALFVEKRNIEHIFSSEFFKEQPQN